MARSRKPEKPDRKRGAYRAPRKMEAKLRPPAPEDEQVEEMKRHALDMAEILSCPMHAGDDHVNRLDDATSDAELGRDLAMIAVRLHPTSPVTPVLAEIAEAYERHLRDFAELRARLASVIDHDAAHEHVQLDEEAQDAMLATLFAMPPEEDLA